jgi:hypothetical protein
VIQNITLNAVAAAPVTPAVASGWLGKVIKRIKASGAPTADAKAPPTIAKPTTAADWPEISANKAPSARGPFH